MIQEIWTVFACAVEDDRIVFLDADIGYDDGRVFISAVGEPQQIKRHDFRRDDPDDDQHDFDLDELTYEIARRATNLGREVHFVAISTFGTVNVQTGNVEFYPHSEGVITRRTSHVRKCLPIEVKRSLPDMHSLIEVFVDNDATASAVGEHAVGAGKDCDDLAYVWAGRGINVGLVLQRAPWEGRLHPEAGHILPRRHTTENISKGACTNHEGCLTSLAALSSIYQRRKDGMEESKIVDRVAFYFAQLCMSVTLIAAPARIVIGGLILDELPTLLAKVRKEYVRLIGNYPQYTQQARHDFIQPSKHSQMAAVLGMIEVTRQEIERHFHATAD
jgi:predicted NBD/HSP70 family sugar kinase